jgi:uncharacterized protein YaiI (UPF0178 family)
MVVFMRILVDADACPVKEIIIKVAKEYSLEVIMLIDTSHILSSEYCEVVTVDKAKDSVDIALFNRLKGGDIVVTQDYGVATMALSKNAYAINQNGMVFDMNNMDRLLFERYLSQKVRRAGGKTSNPRKRTSDDDEKFEMSFRRLCSEAIKNLAFKSL